VSETSYLSIGEVLQLLQAEFPDVTISKIRFLESQGLIDPERTPSGYRKFYDQDIDRLKFILREQKDSYLPLKVIKHRLDAGESTGPVVRPMMSVDPDGVLEGGHRPNTGHGGGSDPTEPTERVTSEPVTSESEAADPATTPGPMAGAAPHATTEGPAAARTSRAELERLFDADVVYREPNAVTARLLRVRRGAIASAVDASSGELDRAGVARLEGRACFDRATYDRLRVLTTELKRIARDGGEVSVRWGAGRALSAARAPGVLKLV